MIFLTRMFILPQKLEFIFSSDFPERLRNLCEETTLLDMRKIAFQRDMT